MGDVVTPPAAPAGWYPDPDRPGGQRYFDGQWTEHRVDPPPPRVVLPQTPEMTERHRRQTRWVVIGSVATIVVTFVSIGVAALVSPGSRPSDVGAEVVCEQAVSGQLKSPATASFDLYPSVTHDGDDYTVVGWVDAENGFGAKIRSNYSCNASWLGHRNWQMGNVAVTGP